LTKFRFTKHLKLIVLLYCHW